MSRSSGFFGGLKFWWTHARLRFRVKCIAAVLALMLAPALAGVLPWWYCLGLIVGTAYQILCGWLYTQVQKVRQVRRVHELTSRDPHEYSACRPAVMMPKDPTEALRVLTAIEAAWGRLTEYEKSAFHDISCMRRDTPEGREVADRIGVLMAEELASQED